MRTSECCREYQRVEETVETTEMKPDRNEIRTLWFVRQCREGERELKRCGVEAGTERSEIIVVK